MRLFLSSTTTMTFSVLVSSRYPGAASFMSKAHFSTTSPYFMSFTHIDVPLLSLENMDIFHLRRTVDSTQDEAKRLIDTFRPKGSLAVIAEHQRKGRGTSGRSWVATEGNLFLTVAIPMDDIPHSKLTLLPLGVGLLIAQTVRPRLVTRPTLKWPNDVLIDGMKIAGTLIENHSSDQGRFWMVGVGVNVLSHPLELPSENHDFRSKPRSATHLQKYANSNQNMLSALDLGVELATGLQEWVAGLGSLDGLAFTSSWKTWVDFSADYELRKTGERVKLLDMELDGQLRVIDGEGKERLLIADNFF